MKFEALAETCELEIKQSNCEVDENLNIINGIADKVEQVISSKLEEFNKTVNTVETPPINNSGESANNDNAGDSTGNNESANGSAEQE